MSSLRSPRVLAAVLFALGAAAASAWANDEIAGFRRDGTGIDPNVKPPTQLHYARLYCFGK